MIITVIILWILYSGIEGEREAWYYHYKINAVNPRLENLHPMFALQRGMVLFFIWYCLPWIMILGLACVFPFFHDGMYYEQRHRLNNAIYPKKWWDDSTTSTAKLELKLWMRITLLVIGIILIGYGYQTIR